MTNFQEVRFYEIHNIYLDELDCLDQENLLLNIQGKEEDLVVVTKLIHHWPRHFSVLLLIGNLLAESGTNRRLKVGEVARFYYR